MTESAPLTTAQKTVAGWAIKQELKKQNEKREFRFQYKVTVLLHLKLKMFPRLCVKVAK